MASNSSVYLPNLPTVTTCNNVTDKILIIKSNTPKGNSSLITVDNLLLQNVNIQANGITSNTISSNVIILNDERIDPANSVALTITRGTIFFSDDCLYIAVSNNVVKRANLELF